MKNTDALESFLNLSDEALFEIRNHTPALDIRLNDLKEALVRLRDHWRDNTDIPKSFAAAALDLSTALYSASSQARSAEERQFLWKKFDELTDLMRDALNDPSA